MVVEWPVGCSWNVWSDHRGARKPSEIYELGAWLNPPSRALGQNPVVAVAVTNVQDASGQWRCTEVPAQGATPEQAQVGAQQTTSPAGSATEGAPAENKELEQAAIAIAVAYNCCQMFGDDDGAYEKTKVRFRDALATAGTVEDPDGAIVELEKELGSEPADSAQLQNPMLTGACETIKEAASKDPS